MPHDQQEKRVGGLLNALGIGGAQFQGIKLGPGVVGRNSSLVGASLVVMLAGVTGSIIEHSSFVLELSIFGAIVLPFFGMAFNVYFGCKNPGAALLEGAQLLKYQQMMAAKDNPFIEPTTPVPPPKRLPEDDEPPPSLPGQST